MTLIINERAIRFSWGTVINLAEFPQLLTLFQKNVPSRPNAMTTAAIEQQGALLARRGWFEKGGRSQ